MSSVTYDVFLSHAWVDQQPVRVVERPQRGLAPELLGRLEAAGLNVFFDANEVEHGAPISPTVIEGLANSSVFVVWYSTMYPTREACRWELTTASRVDVSKRRIFGVNPEVTGVHISGTPLKDTRLAACPDPTDQDGWARLVSRIKEAVADANGEVFGTFDETPPKWFPNKQRRAERFTGRLRELWAMHEILTAHPLTGQQTAVAGAAVVDGMGGAGKTVLALEYAHRYSAAWPGGVVWIKGHGFDHGHPADATPEGRRAALNDELQTLAISLEIDLSFLVPISSPTAQMTALRRAIGGELGENGPVLWVVDDLPPGLSAAEIEQWSAPGNIEGAKTLVTTRTTEYNYGFTRLALDQLSTDEGYQLLTGEHTPADERQRQAAHELVEVLGGHALALDVTRAGVTGPNGYTAWLDRLRSETATVVATLDLLGELAGSLTADHSTSVATTLAMSIDRLDADARAVLELCACFDSLPIPFDMLDAMLEPDRRRLGTTKLGCASLATVGADETITLHRLVIVVDRIVSGLEATPILDAQVAAAEALAGAMSAIQSTHLAQPFANHFRLAQSLHLVPAKRHDVDHWCGWFLQLSGRELESVPLLERVVGERLEELGESHPDTLIARVSLAISYRVTQRPLDAITLLERVLEDSAEIRGERHPVTLTARAYLASTYQQVGRLDEAIVLQEALLEDRLEEFGGRHRETLSIRGDLAGSYWRVRRTDDARCQWEQVVAEGPEVMGSRHPETITARANLASCYRDLDRNDDAIDLLEQVVTDRAELLGHDHADTNSARASLAASYWHSARSHDAIALLTQAIQLEEPRSDGQPYLARWRSALASGSTVLIASDESR
jgi:tetratricopeptide (TPR) repeat protein